VKTGTHFNMDTRFRGYDIIQEILKYSSFDANLRRMEIQNDRAGLFIAPRALSGNESLCPAPGVCSSAYTLVDCHYTL
jgi:hypothetical protein